MSQPVELTGRVAVPANADVIPDYLRLHYWWAYVHPRAIRLFERKWLVNLILWHNYRRLSEAAIDALGEAGPADASSANANPRGDSLSGRTLQIACVYGDLTERLSRRCAAAGGVLDVVDVLVVQLENLARKLPADAPAQLIARNAEDLALPDASYDRALLFFLLHEQPREVRERTLSEALRVVRPGGTVVVVDYALPEVWHPARYLWLPVLRVIEPFARDLWRHELARFLPEPWSSGAHREKRFFGGLYQLVRITR